MMTEKQENKTCKFMFIHISRAHFYSPARRKIYVELAPERRRPGWCGFLQKSKHGTRDAAANFAAMVMEVLTGMNFVIGEFNPCLCKHVTKDIKLVCEGIGRLSDRESARCVWSRREGCEGDCTVE